jgi:aspartate racemase
MNRELKYPTADMVDTADTINAAPAPAGRPGAAPRCFGVIGGLGPLASADVFFKLVKATPAASDAEHLDLIFEQRPFRGPQHSPGQGAPDYTARKLYIFDMIRAFERRGAHAVILPCFLSHTFMAELKANSALPIVDMVEAVRAHVRSKYPGVRRIGVLASDYTRGAGLFERYFQAPEFELLHARTRAADGTGSAVDAAVYGAAGIKAGQLGGAPLESLAAACTDLIEQGAELIVPGLTEIAIVIDTLRAQLGEAVPVLDANLIYARYAISGAYASAAKPFKVGVLGGVGPAATVDFVRKLVANTPAACDQDHIKLIVEQNPQIPDRTENLIGQGPDPTIALYATCKKLEAGDADLIAIPCNTAHAFVERIQPYLSIPIVPSCARSACWRPRARWPAVCISRRSPPWA